MNYKFVIAALLASTTSFAQIEKGDILIQTTGVYGKSSEEKTGISPAPSYQGGFSERGIRLTGTYMLTDRIGVGIGSGYLVSDYVHTEDSFTYSTEATVLLIDVHARYNLYQKGSFVAFTQLNMGIAHTDGLADYGGDVRPREAFDYQADLDLGVGYFFGKHVYASIEFDLLRYVVGSEEGLEFNESPYELDYSRFELSTQLYRAMVGIGVKL